MVSNISFCRRCHAPRFVNPTEIILHVVKGDVIGTTGPPGKFLFRASMLEFEQVMNRLFSFSRAAQTLLAILTAASLVAGRNRKDTQLELASVDIEIGKPECKVDLDDATIGQTASDGSLQVATVPPADHYIHVDCPGQEEMAFFISPVAGQTVRITPQLAISGNAAAAVSPLEQAQKRIELNHAVQQAVRLRARGELDQAVTLLHEATRLDPENSDLHRELGITFLLGKDWDRARVEMLEAIRHDPQDADAHNGLGYALDKLGDLDGALKEYRKATRLDPDDSTYQEHYLEALGKMAARQDAAKEKRR
jgi:tetratricopeptide (TPR) repeat protein